MPCKFKKQKKMAKKYQYGGNISGPKHEQGGININVEGGEFVVNDKAVNSQTKAVLEYINTYGKLPRVFDARKRGKK